MVLLLLRRLRGLYRLANWREVATRKWVGGITGVVHLKKTDVGDRLLEPQLYIPLSFVFLVPWQNWPADDIFKGDCQKGGSPNTIELQRHLEYVQYTRSVIYLGWRVNRRQCRERGATCPQSGYVQELLYSVQRITTFANSQPRRR